jgi:hypothetical protein
MLVSEFEDMKPAESVGWRVAVGAGLATVGIAVATGLPTSATATATTTATAIVWLFGGSIGGRLACRRFIERRITVVRRGGRLVVDGPVGAFTPAATASAALPVGPRSRWVLRLSAEGILLLGPRAVTALGSVAIADAPGDFLFREPSQRIGTRRVG